jgi:hypothetical protein
MLLSDIFEQLSYGELSQVFIGEGGPDSEGVPKASRKKMLAHVRLGLTELHKRFLLKERTLNLSITAGKQTYVLDKAYAQSNTASSEENKYIQDAADPFQNDLFKVERVYDADGNELPLNILDDPESVQTPNYNTLVLPDDYTGSTLKVVYRADHPPIDPYLVTAAPQIVEVNLPATHLEPLLLYVASRVMNPVGLSGEFHEGNNYAGKFEASCRRLEQSNFRVDSQGQNTRLERNGWV